MPGISVSFLSRRFMIVSIVSSRKQYRQLRKLTSTEIQREI